MSGEELRELATKSADHNRLGISQDEMIIEIKEALEARTIWLPRLFLNGYVKLARQAYKQGRALRSELNYHNPASVN